MKKTDIRKFFTKKKKAVAGCIAAAVILAGGFNVWQSSQVPEFPDYTDPVMEATITDDDTPLASKPKVTTKTTSSTKTTRQNVRLKKAATKTYTKKLPTTQKKSTTTKKTNSNTTVKTLKTVKTATTQKYTKRSKTVVQTRKITTTVQTTTTVVQAASSGNNKAAAASTSTAAKTTTAKSAENLNMDSKYTVSNIASIAPAMDSRVLNAYKKLGFTVTIDPSVSYGGYFNARSRSITLRYADGSVYHELGHFLAFIAGNADKTSSFVAVYNNEKSKYTGLSKSYATQNSSEYFADSVRDYVENPSALKSQRPQTYAAIVEALNKVTDSQVEKVLKVYGPFWK